MAANMAGLLRPYGPRREWTQRTANGFELFYPRDANATQLTNNTGLAAWTYPASFSQIVASTSADFNAHAIHELLQVIPQTSGTKRFLYEVEIATGAAGSEVVIARYSNAFTGAITAVDPSDHTTTGRTYPMGPVDIPSGTRLSGRARCELIDTAVNMNVTLYLAGYESSVIPDSDATYPLDGHLAGNNNPNLLATPTGSALSLIAATFIAGYSSTWTQVWASAAADSLVWGIEGYITTGVANGSRYIQFGIGAASSETPYAAIAMPGKLGLAVGRYMLRRPLLVLAGERLAVRAKGTSIVAYNTQVLYEEL